jgi:hypothetical protein
MLKQVQHDGDVDFAHDALDGKTRSFAREAGEACASGLAFAKVMQS